LTIRLHVGLITGARARGAEREVVLSLEAGAVHVRELIEAVVRHEVDAFRQQSIDATALRILTPSAIRDGLAAGVIRHGGDEERPAVDVDSAVDVALLAFADGVFEVFVDGKGVLIGELLTIDDGSHVSFLRLMPLIGS